MPRLVVYELEQPAVRKTVTEGWPPAVADKWIPLRAGG